MDQDVVELPSTPAGDQARWFLGHQATRGRDLTEGEIAAHMALPPPWTPAQSLGHFRAEENGPFEISKVATPSEHEIAVTFASDDGRATTLTLTIEQDAPHRIVRTWFAKAVADDVAVRAAAPSDSSRLNDLEVRAPMTIGGHTTVVYDRGDDFLAFTRLMEENICFVGHRADELLGLACGAAHPVTIGGNEYRVMLLHHLRVPVEHRKGGVFSTLNGHVFGAYHGRTDGAYGYTALDNAEAMRIGGPGTWSVKVHRVVLDCGTLAGDAFGRIATKGDADQIVDIINACHRGEEAFHPYTIESLRARLERAPDLYTWEHLRLSDDAVVGVWPARIRVTMDDGTTRSEDVRAVVLDHGFRAGSGDQFESLLRAHCAELAADGHTELMTLTSEPSPNFPVVSTLAKRMDPFAFRMAVPEPPGTASAACTSTPCISDRHVLAPRRLLASRHQFVSSRTTARGDGAGYNCPPGSLRRRRPSGTVGAWQSPWRSFPVRSWPGSRCAGGVATHRCPWAKASRRSVESAAAGT